MMKLVVGLVIGIALGIYLADTQPVISEQIRVWSDTVMTALGQTIDKAQSN
ncbi:hypothetical protein [uncultured Photobacterium sp.]|uniref:hypothetical protein n=1 Tax=uncultured Photobacterium sp. TaxID=173973 RepID=UPI00261827A5|nr:hypothetical protein [uncultured Photobacterium sp.]